jgi:hypothetical protein
MPAATAPRDVQVMILTGQSDPGRCALSPVQQAFLDALPVPGAAKLRLNFPYSESTAWRQPSLLGASLANGRQYLASRRRAFADRHAPAVLRQLAQAQHTVILAGSCGLELLANLTLPASALRDVQVFAYGPVARRRPACDCVLVQGRRDWISRWWFPQVDHVVDCGHLDYLESPEVLALCIDTLRRSAAARGAA